MEENAKVPTIRIDISTDMPGCGELELSALIQSYLKGLFSQSGSRVKVERYSDGPSTEETKIFGHPVPVVKASKIVITSGKTLFISPDYLEQEVRNEGDKDVVWKRLVHEGRDMEAVRQCRAINGCGLLEAKQMVEGYAKRRVGYGS